MDRRLFAARRDSDAADAVIVDDVIKCNDLAMGELGYEEFS